MGVTELKEKCSLARIEVPESEIPKEFECQRCGRCCRYIIKDSWVDVVGEMLEIWRKNPSLIHHPFFQPNASEFWAAKNIFRGGRVREVWNFLESEERRIESLIKEPVKFLWGGMLRYCPFLKRERDIYLCLIHGEAKPHRCRGWPDISYENSISYEASVEEAKSVGCKGIEILETSAHHRKWRARADLLVKDELVKSLRKERFELLNESKDLKTKFEKLI